MDSESGLASVLMISIRNISGAIHQIGPAKCAVYFTSPCFRIPTIVEVKERDQRASGGYVDHLRRTHESRE